MTNRPRSDFKSDPRVEPEDDPPASLDRSLEIEMQALEALARKEERLHSFNRGHVLKHVGTNEPAYLFLTKGSVSVQQDARSGRGQVSQRVCTIRPGEPLNYGATITKNLRDVAFRYVAEEDDTRIVVITDALLANQKIREIVSKRANLGLAHQCVELRDSYAKELAANADFHEADSRATILAERVEELVKDRDDEVDAHEISRGKLKAMVTRVEEAELANAKLAGQLATLKETNEALRKAHAPLVQFLLTIDQKQRDAYAKFSDAFRGWINTQSRTYTKDETDKLIARLIEQGQLPFPKELSAALEEEVHSQVMQAEEQSPFTSRSPTEPPPVESELEVTAPHPMKPIIEQKEARRTSPPKAQPVVEPPSTVQHGRRPLLSAFSAMAMGAPATKHSSSLPPAPVQAPSPTLVPAVPHSAMPPTVEATPAAKKIPLLIPTVALPPRPASVPRPTPKRNVTPFGIDHPSDAPPLTQRGQGARHPSIKIPLDELPVHTSRGIEPMRLAEPPRKQPYKPSPGAMKAQRPGGYSHVSDELAVSEKTLERIENEALRPDDDDTNETGRSTINLIPESYRAEDEKEDAPPPREVTKQYIFKKP